MGRQLVAVQLAYPLQIDPPEVTPVSHSFQLFFELLHVTESLHQAQGLTQRQLFAATEWVRLPVGVVRHQPAQQLPELSQLLLQLGIAECRIQCFFELLAHFGRERVEQALHRRHLLRQVVEQFLDALEIAAEIVSPAVLEPLEIRLPTASVLAEKLVEVAQHLPEFADRFRREILDRLLKSLERLLEHLSLQRREEFLELAAGFRIHELVVAQGTDPTGRIRRELVEERELLLGEALQQTLERGIRYSLFSRPLSWIRWPVSRTLLRRRRLCTGALQPLASLAHAPLDAHTFRADHVLEPLVQLAQDRTRIVPLQQLLPLLLDSLQEFAESWHSAIRAIHSPAKKSL